MRRMHFIWICAAFVLFLFSFSRAEPTVRKFYYQKATPITPGSYTFRFTLWDADPSKQTPVWSEEKTVQVTCPLIRTYLGEINSFNGIDFSRNLWVQVELKEDTRTYKVVGDREMLKGAWLWLERRRSRKEAYTKSKNLFRVEAVEAKKP